MSNTENLDPRTRNFSQANGYEELPRPIALGRISDEARRRLWDLLWLSAWTKKDRFDNQFWATVSWTDIFQVLHTEFMQLPLDEFNTRPTQSQFRFRGFVLSHGPPNRLFDMWLIIMRHIRCPREFIEETTRIFEECRLAYVVDTNGPPTILPAATQQEGETLTDALRQLKEGGHSGAQTHLREAGIQINAGDWAESVRESIHAVESVARQLDPKNANTLESALKSLDKQVRIHPALKNALSNLYGYTSDEQGIRHAILDMPESPVGRDEAVFMLGACASFVTYLLSKHRAV